MGARKAANKINKQCEWSEPLSELHNGTYVGLGRGSGASSGGGVALALGAVGGCAWAAGCG